MYDIRKLFNCGPNLYSSACHNFDSHTSLRTERSSCPEEPGRLTIVSSESAFCTAFKEQKFDPLLPSLNGPKLSDSVDRYYTPKGLRADFPERILQTRLSVRSGHIYRESRILLWVWFSVAGYRDFESIQCGWIQESCGKIYGSIGARTWSAQQQCRTLVPMVNTSGTIKRCHT